LALDVFVQRARGFRYLGDERLKRVGQQAAEALASRAITSRTESSSNVVTRAIASASAFI